MDRSAWRTRRPIEAVREPGRGRAHPLVQVLFTGRRLKLGLKKRTKFFLRPILLGGDRASPILRIEAGKRCDGADCLTAV